MAALGFGIEISIAISILLVAVAISYRQICIAYPTGGGSYTVSRKNIGRTVSLVAASALLIDYVMTVAVSTASAVEQVISAVPAVEDWRGGGGGAGGWSITAGEPLGDAGGGEPRALNAAGRGPGRGGEAPAATAAGTTGSPVSRRAAERGRRSGRGW